ncbi:MAG TPA: hypothetical protein VFL15_11615 [Gammaproteobacteria bacterium]|nr:hypothetical protein [Gammaproteobacteria bacterium]
MSSQKRMKRHHSGTAPKLPLAVEILEFLVTITPAAIEQNLAASVRRPCLDWVKMTALNL